MILDVQINAVFLLLVALTWTSLYERKQAFSLGSVKSSNVSESPILTYAHIDHRR
jgi:hypothetical protein